MDSAASSLSRSSLESRAGAEVALAATATTVGCSVRERISRLERLVLGRACSDDRVSEGAASTSAAPFSSHPQRHHTPQPLTHHDCPDARDPAAYAWCGGGVRERATSGWLRRDASSNSGKSCSSDERVIRPSGSSGGSPHGGSGRGSRGSGRRRVPGVVRLRPRQPPRSQCSARRRAIAAAHAAHNEIAVRAHGTHGPLTLPLGQASASASSPGSTAALRGRLISASRPLLRDTIWSASMSEVPVPQSPQTAQPPSPDRYRRHRDASDGGSGRVTGGVTGTVAGTVPGTVAGTVASTAAGNVTGGAAASAGSGPAAKRDPERAFGGATSSAAEGLAAIAGTSGAVLGGVVGNVPHARPSTSSLASLSSDGGLREEISTSALIEFYERKARQARAAARRFVNRCEREHAAARDGLCIYESEEEEEDEEEEEEEEEGARSGEERLPLSSRGGASPLEFTYVRRALSALRLLEEARVRWPRCACASSCTSASTCASVCACSPAHVSSSLSACANGSNASSTSALAGACAEAGTGTGTSRAGSGRGRPTDETPSPPRTAPPAVFVDRASSAVSFFDTRETASCCATGARVDRACSPFRMRRRGAGASQSSFESSDGTSASNHRRKRGHWPLTPCSHRRHHRHLLRRGAVTDRASSSSDVSGSRAAMAVSFANARYDDPTMSVHKRDMRSPSCGVVGSSNVVGAGAAVSSHSQPGRCGEPAERKRSGSRGGGSSRAGRAADPRLDPPKVGDTGGVGVSGSGLKSPSSSQPPSSPPSSLSASTRLSRSESLSASDHGHRPRCFCSHLSRRESWTDSKTIAEAARKTAPPTELANGESQDPATTREPARKGRRVFATTPHLPPRRDGYRRLRRRPPPRYKDSLRQFFEEAAFLSKMGIKCWNLQESCCDVILGSVSSKPSQPAPTEKENCPEGLKDILDNFLLNLLFPK